MYTASVSIQTTKTEIPSQLWESCMQAEFRVAEEVKSNYPLKAKIQSCVVVSSKFICFHDVSALQAIGTNDSHIVTQDWTPAKMQVPLCSCSVTCDPLSEAEMSLTQAVLHQQLILPSFPS